MDYKEKFHLTGYISTAPYTSSIFLTQATENYILKQFTHIIKMDYISSNGFKPGITSTLQLRELSELT